MKENTTKKRYLSPMFFLFYCIIACLILVSAFCVIKVNQELKLSFSNQELTTYTREVQTTYVSSSFMIKVEQKVLDEDGEEATLRKIGSAFIFDGDDNYYYCLTNEHVSTINYDGTTIGTTEYKFFDYKGNELAGNYIFSDSNLDVAIFSIPKENQYKVLSFAKENAKSGDKLINISSSLGVQNQLSFGFLYAEKENLQYATNQIENGSSGSFMLNTKFEIVGQVQAQTEETRYCVFLKLDKLKEYINSVNYK